MDRHNIERFVVSSAFLVLSQTLARARALTLPLFFCGKSVFFIWISASVVFFAFSQYQMNYCEMSKVNWSVSAYAHTHKLLPVARRRRHRLLQIYFVYFSCFHFVFHCSLLMFLFFSHSLLCVQALDGGDMRTLPMLRLKETKRHKLSRKKNKNHKTQQQCTTTASSVNRWFFSLSSSYK